MKKIKLSYLWIIVAVVAFTTSCKRDRTHPGYVYFNDMAPSIAYDYYNEFPRPLTSTDSGAVTAYLPVAGTVARGQMDYVYAYPKTFDGQKLAGEELVNPADFSVQTLEHGKQMYTIYCLICHGETGKGDGPLYTSGKYTAKPTSLIDGIVRDKKDGELYHVITKGSLSGLMGGHGGQLKPDSRWAIINYIRHELTEPASTASVNEDDASVK